MVKLSAHLLVVLALFLASVHAQKAPIDFQEVLDNPDLLGEFEIRYVLSPAALTQDWKREYLRVRGTRSASLTTWSAEHPGSLAPVCRTTLSPADLRKLLELFRDAHFVELKDDSGLVFREAAFRGWSTIVVRQEKARMKKLNYHLDSRPHPELEMLELALDRIARGITAENGARCDIEMVPSAPN